MANPATSVCNDTSEAVDLLSSHGLFLKPLAPVNISAQLPSLKNPGNSISNWEVMEKLKKMIRPDNFIVLKVAKSTLEFIRFEGELENRALIKVIISRLDGKTIKLSGFPDPLKIRSAEAKCNFPSRHDWDSYFRDAKNMDEMKPGERPDTIHLTDLPSRWFSGKKDKERDKPCESILRKVFESYGEVHCIDIPMLDPYRREMVLTKRNTGGLQTFNFGQDLTFDAYVQFRDYIGFVKAMNALRGMKLMYKNEQEENGKAYTSALKVDFDKTKHLSEKSIRKRRLEREKLIRLEKEREERVRRERQEEARKKEAERLRLEEEAKERQRKHEEKVLRREQRRLEREEKRRLKRIEKRRREEDRLMQLRIATEERKILIARRKLETIRLFSELLDRVKVIKQEEEVARKEREAEEESRRQAEAARMREMSLARERLLQEKRRKQALEQQEITLRDKILNNIRAVEERRREQSREQLRRKIASNRRRLRSAVASSTAVNQTASSSSTAYK